MTFSYCKKCGGLFPPEKIGRYSQLCTECASEDSIKSIKKGFIITFLIILMSLLSFLLFGTTIGIITFLVIIILITIYKTSISTTNKQTVTNKIHKVWANNILSSKTTVLLDCETTGLNKNDEIIQLAIIDMQGNILFDSLIKPSPRKHISQEASNIHGITKETLKKAPIFPDVVNEILSIINGKRVVTYNAEFDKRMLLQTMNKYPKVSSCNIKRLDVFFDCAMKQYSSYIGEWVEWKRDYKWQKLPGGDHSALGDCIATLEIIKEMANS